MSLEDDMLNARKRLKPCDSCFVYIGCATSKCPHCGELTASGRRKARRKEEQKYGRA